MKKGLASVLVLFFVLTLCPHKAEADEYWTAMQVSCNKDLNYFSFKTIVFDNAISEEKIAIGNVDQKSGIFPLHNYTCDLPAFSYQGARGSSFPARRIKVQVYPTKGNDYIDSCAIPTSIGLRVSVNGIVVGKFPAYAQGCGNLATRFIELDAADSLTSCALITESYIGKENGGCYSKYLKWK